MKKINKVINLIDNISSYLFISVVSVYIIYYILTFVFSILLSTALPPREPAYFSGLAGYFSRIYSTSENIAIRAPYNIPYVLNVIINGDGCFFITTQLVLFVIVILKVFKWQKCHELSIFLSFVHILSYLSVLISKRMPYIMLHSFLHSPLFIYPLFLLIIFLPISIMSYINKAKEKDSYYFNKLFKSLLITTIVICFLSILSSFYMVMALSYTSIPQDEFVKWLYDTYAKNPLNIVFSAPGTVRSTLYVTLVLSIVFGVIYKIKSRKEKLLEKSC